MKNRRALSNEKARVKTKLAKYQERQRKGLNIVTGDRDSDVVAFTSIELRFLDIYQNMVAFKELNNKKEYCAAGFQLWPLIIDLQDVAHTPGPLSSRVQQLNRTMRDLHAGVVRINDEIHNRNQQG